MKKFETHKLFWDKYLYKLVVKNRLATVFRNKNFAHAARVLENLRKDYVEGVPLFLIKSKRQDIIKEDQYLDAEKLLKIFSSSDDYKIRIESSTLSIYSNDVKWLRSLSKSLDSANLSEFWEPAPESIQYLLEKTVILEEKINYQFRVTLGSRRGNQGFANFAKKNPHLVRVGPVLLKELEQEGWVNGMYFYARDEKVIELCHLMLGNIRRIDKVIYKQDIDK